MTDMIRICPSCGSHRAEYEMHCEFEVSKDVFCDWPLLNERLLTPSQVEQLKAPAPSEPQQPPLTQVRTCVNGHELSDGDLICFVCGEPELIKSVATEFKETLIGEIIDEWCIEEQLFQDSASEEFYCVKNQESQQTAFLILYKEEDEPDPDIYRVMNAMDHDHVPELIKTGRWRKRPFEIHEWIEGGSLHDAGTFGFSNPDDLHTIIDEIAKALKSFSEVGLRHRDINPRTILLRNRAPLDLVITDFGSARLSDFDLDMVSPLTLTRYSAPEAIVGAISSASDWWSLGMIILEQVTNGECFEEINEKAYMLHTVTVGVEIPQHIDTSVRHLLQGLLIRDPNLRWQAEQVFKWLNGKDVELPANLVQEQKDDLSTAITLGGKTFFSPERFALSAAEFENWSEGNELFQKGELQTWLREYDGSFKKTDRINRLVVNDKIREDFKYPLALMVLNPSLPLTFKGDLITPSWLIKNPDIGYELIFGSTVSFLEELERESWLVHLQTRGKRVLERAAILEIELEDDFFRRLSIVTSRAKLEAEENLLRQTYPDSDHAGLASLIHKKRLNEEDLLVLLCAKRQQLTPLTVVLDSAEKLAQQYKINTFDKDKVIAQLTLSLPELYKLVDERIADFARCGIERVDDWADVYRIERRLTIQRVIVILSVEQEKWLKPEKQQYKENIIKFFEKRVASAVLRGPLVRLTISKSSSRIDLMEINSPAHNSESLLNFLLERNGVPRAIDPQAFLTETLLLQRIHRMANQAAAYSRETGIDSLYLGFPFLLMNSKSSKNAKPRIAPLLLWPIKLDNQNYRTANYTISFDKEREEVRLNPALEGLLGKKIFEQLLTLRDELLNLASIRVKDVMSLFSTWGNVEHYHLTSHPPLDTTVIKDNIDIICSAVLFNAKFVGQAISEDLRQLRQLPIKNTALNTLLKMEEATPLNQENTSCRADKSFAIVESDPSQNIAINFSRKAPGVVIEGPPGTGKSQTIVNIIADSIGRGESVLVVCQKQAALNVVRKRLEAENLGQRLCGIIDINRDRLSVIRLIREQVESIFSGDTNTIQQTKVNRSNTIDKVNLLENEINAFHNAVFEIIPQANKSYRDVICGLIDLESNTKDYISCPPLREVLATLTPGQLFEVESLCSSLANDWLPSNYENSPYHALKRFNSDPSITKELKQRLILVKEQEVKREQTLSDYSSEFDDGNISNYTKWIDQYDALFKTVSDEDMKNITDWYELLFTDNQSSVQLANEFLEKLESINKQLTECSRKGYDSAFFDYVLKLENKDAAKYIHYCQHLLSPKTLFSKLNIFRTLRAKAIKRTLINIEGSYRESRIIALKNAIELELEVRPVRRNLSRIYKNLKQENKELEELHITGLRAKAEKLFNEFSIAKKVAAAVIACPRKEDAILLFRAPSLEGYDSFKAKLNGAVVRYHTRTESREQIKILRNWFEDGWIEDIDQKILDNEKTSHLINKLIDEHTAINAFQSFRTRTLNTNQKVFDVFVQLREKQAQLSETEATRLPQCIKNTIRRESLLSLKAQTENKHPVLLSDSHTLSEKVKLLDRANNELSDANRTLLSSDIVLPDMSKRSSWESITRLRGPRTKKLREFVDLGTDIGLMDIRPVWLMNPEVVSQVLPLKAGLFDVVIFDEASQMLVDHCLPALYRAKRVIISGDEKQMPPSSSFSRKTDDDEDEVIEELDEDMSEAEISAIEEAWNKKEIKDCPDLLALGRSVLPYTTLQIHYRSEYNALIEFSNYAFYSGQLNVPTKHPISEIKKNKPVELIKVNGIYAEQTNPTEAKQIVKMLKSYWLEGAQPPPSIGVVTFNLKQAEEIEAVIQHEASVNDEFAQAYFTQQDHTQNGEDMGFFVKNVENVQGDERDIIIFSTTFGYNPQGAFRRNFGVLGHKGGEKRLNVAITRARKKVSIVTSMPIDKISDMLGYGRMPNKPRDYIQAYLDYADKKSNGEIELARLRAMKLTQAVQSNQSIESDNDSFVAEVKEFIQSLGGKAAEVNEGDAFGLDLAIENPATGLFELGIECDAPRHELLATATYREIWRKKVLQRSVKKIHRISCIEWYENKAIEKDKLSKLLAEINNINIMESSL